MIKEIYKKGVHMNSSLSYIKNTALGIVGFLVLFIGIGAMTVVLNLASWQQLSDWTLKAVIIAVILFALNVVGSIIAGLMKKEK